MSSWDTFLYSMIQFLYNLSVWSIISCRQEASASKPKATQDCQEYGWNSDCFYSLASENFQHKELGEKAEPK